jgi:site-specific DNA-methyltransferase (adenine-specific)
VEAKLSGRRAVGIDLNPLATAISGAKMEAVEIADVTYRIRELANTFRGEQHLDEVPETLEPIFHRRTLAQLCYLRGVLDGSVPEDRFLTGAVLGIMHGKGRQSGSTAYLSVDMPNTFSMSPDYVRDFVKRHALRAPTVDVFAKLRERAEWLLRAGPLPKAPNAYVITGDATQLHHLLPGIGVRTVGAIITSPPYLGVLRYGAFNWIRLWFLRQDPVVIDQRLDGTDSLDRYLSFISNFLSSAGRVLRPGGLAILVIGDVVEHGQHLKLAPRLWEELQGLIPFELAHLKIDAYDQSAKTTRVWGEQRKGRATPQDRVLVLRRVGRRDV